MQTQHKIQPSDHTDRTPSLGSAGEGCVTPVSPPAPGVCQSAGAVPLAAPDAPDPFDVLDVRGVSREVAAARGYIAYFGRAHPRHDPDTARAELARHDLTPGQRATLMRLMNGARDAKGRDGYGDGLVIPKCPFPGEAPIVPQLRPRVAVRTGNRTWHRHDKAFGNPRDLERHLTNEYHDPSIGDRDRHSHENVAKYLLCPNGKRDTYHDHATDPAFQGPKGRQKLRAHRRAHHHGQHVQGEHKHRRDKPGQHIADRLDIHPWALDRLPEAERVYFAIEGTPKADAILSKIIETDALASVFDVPSVTLWDAPELYRIARHYLAGREVVIVPDADWHDNPAVVRQALLCREFLRDCGVSACIAAPPDDRDAEGELLYKGVDDFLAKGGELDDLRVLDRERDNFPLALHAKEDGTIGGMVWSFVKILGCRRDAGRVVEQLRWYIDAGFVTADRELELEPDEYTGALRWKGKREDWPTFTIDTDWRYTETPTRLGDCVAPQAPPTRFGTFSEGLIGPGGRSLREQLATAKRRPEGDGVSASTVSREPLIRLVNDYLKAYQAANLRKLGYQAGPAYGITVRGAQKAIRAEHDPEELRRRVAELPEHERRLFWRAIDNALIERYLSAAEKAADIRACYERGTTMTTIQAEEIIARLDRIERKMERISREQPSDDEFLREIGCFLDGVAQARRLDEAA